MSHTKTLVHLGFEVISGERVEIPLRHMVVTGQTQESGKTTTLEALVERSGVKAVAFVTKRGEGSFANARTIRPYFKEQADWKYVAAILEASRGEKLKFERSWIIRASKGATTLADVQQNIRKALADPKTKSLSADVYLTLDAYLDDVVPLIAKVDWAQSVELEAGLNVMDMTALNDEMQHLVIRSTIEWVLKHEENTVVVVPEAWKFIPQGRGTPVKLAAESFIRQAAALHNYLWLDSQDIAGVEKIILKSVPVWILGVQRESNEVERTIAQIPAGIKRPSKSEVATLSLGQFFVCYGQHTIKTYVQPAWMRDDVAERIAKGVLRNLPRAPQRQATKPITKPIEPTEPKVTEAEARELRAENERLQREVTRLVGELNARDDEQRESKPDTPSETAPFDYDALKLRLIADLLKNPAVIRAITTKPEIEVTVRRETVELDDTLKGWLAILISEGFFDEVATASAAYSELKRRGKSTAKPNVYKECDKLALMGFLTKEGNGYKSVAGMKVRIVES